MFGGGWEETLLFLFVIGVVGGFVGWFAAHVHPPDPSELVRAILRKDH